MAQSELSRYHTLLAVVFAFGLVLSLTTSTKMSKQTALIVSEVGGRIKLTTDWPIPQPGPKQVQIRVTVAGLNPHDQKARDVGFLIKDNLPAVLAHDIAGIVTHIGSDVTKYKAGDRVFAQSQVSGYEQKALQQYAVVDENFSAKIPVGVKDHDAATVPTNAVAALFGLFEPSGLDIPAPWKADDTFNYAETTLLIIGGGSNCGRFAVQFARMAGIGKIVVVGGSEEELRKWGATHVLDRHGGDKVVLERIREVVGDTLVYVFDAINLPDGQHLAVSALSSSKKGKIARLRFSAGALDESKIVGQKTAAYELRNVLGSSHMYANTSKPFWDRVEGYLQNGSLVPLKYRVVDGLDADSANEVLDGYRDGKQIVQTHFTVSQ